MTSEAKAGVSRGKAVPPFSYRGLKIGIAICRDARIYELYREYAFQGTNLILKPNCAWAGPWEEDGDPDFATLAKEHRKRMRLDWEKDSHFAASNGMAMVCCNTVGDTGFSVFPGGGWFSDGTPGIRKHISLCLRKGSLRERSFIAEFNVSKLKQRTQLIREDWSAARCYYPLPDRSTRC